MGGGGPTTPQTQVITPSQQQVLSPMQQTMDQTLGGAILTGLQNAFQQVGGGIGQAVHSVPQSATNVRGNFPRFSPAAYNALRVQRNPGNPFGFPGLPGGGGAPPAGSTPQMPSQPSGGGPLTGPGGQFPSDPAYGGAPPPAAPPAAQPTPGGGQTPPATTADNPFGMPVVTSYQDPRYLAWQQQNNAANQEAFMQGGFSGGGTWTDLPMPFAFQPDPKTAPLYGMDLAAYGGGV